MHLFNRTVVNRDREAGRPLNHWAPQTMWVFICDSAVEDSRHCCCQQRWWMDRISRWHLCSFPSSLSSSPFLQTNVSSLQTCTKNPAVMQKRKILLYPWQPWSGTSMLAQEHYFWRQSSGSYQRVDGRSGWTTGCPFQLNTAYFFLSWSRSQIWLCVSSCNFPVLFMYMCVYTSHCVTTSVTSKENDN